MMIPGSHADTERLPSAGDAGVNGAASAPALGTIMVPHFVDKQALRDALHRDFDDVHDLQVQANAGDVAPSALTSDLTLRAHRTVTPWGPVQWLLTGVAILLLSQVPLLWAFSEAKLGVGPAVFTCLDLGTARAASMSPRERIALEQRCNPSGMRSVQTFITAEPAEKIPEDAQVVELDMPEAVAPKPVETKYLADITTRTEKQTRSEVASRTQKGAGAAVKAKAAPDASKNATSPEPSRAPPDARTAKPDEAPAETVGDPEEPEGEEAEPRVADIVQNQKGDKGSLKPPSVMDRGKGGGGAQVLMPATSQENVLANIQALAGDFTSNDHLPDVDRGKSTVLNANSYKYADFFHSVKRAVERHWRPGDTYLRRDPSGQVYGVKDRYTVLRVELDRDGKVLSLVTTRTSGLDFMDDEAKRAFSAAQPFPNPPLGLADADGRIRFEFGFFFEITGGKYRFNWRRL